MQFHQYIKSPVSLPHKEFNNQHAIFKKSGNTGNFGETHVAHNFKSLPTHAPIIQRQGDKDKEKKPDHELPNQFTPAEPATDAISGGLSTVADNLSANNPQFNILTDELKLKLWDNQPGEFKAGVIGFAGTSLALTYSALAISMFGQQRNALSNSLEDVNIAAPISIIPFALLKSFKYKYPTPENNRYELSGEVDVSDYLDLLHNQFTWFPKMEAGFGLNIHLDPEKGAVGVKGGMFNIKLLGGGLIASGGVNQQFAAPPQSFGTNDAFSNPVTLMNQIPGGQPQTDTRFGVTVDIPNLINYFSPGDKKSHVQPKLSINQPNDVYEQEADTVADKVMRMHSSHSFEEGRSEAIQRKCSECEEEEKIQRKEATPSSVLDGNWLKSLSGGKPLGNEEKNFFEPRMGYDFSKVRIHDDASANRSAKEINALAYTHANNIVFNTNRYQPNTNEGKKLLAHELTHIVQQNHNKISASNKLQRFASEEHQRLGDVATGKATYGLGTAADKFELTHGDIVALSGDVFMPDELFKLAAIPGDKGKKKGTRDEIVCALQDTRIWEMRAEKKGANPFAQQQDPRFQKGGVFADYVFSDEVKSAVFEKYQKLGAANASHFVAPVGRDKAGAPIASPTGDSAGGKYVKYHEDALTVADKAGRAGSTNDMAMASDAAAQHYLTDSFSAGHLRTPIASIREYWGKKYPLFWYNLRHKIALDTAIEMTQGTVVPNYNAYTGILSAVEAMAPTLPAVTLGDLVASIYHDVDNESGLNTKGGGKVFGDAHLDASTEKLAVDAIKASINDVTKAFDHGKATATPVPDKDLFNDVRKAGGGNATKYAAELVIPEPGPKEPAQNWKAPDIQTLWDQKFLGAKGDKVGDVISKRVQGGSIAIQLTALAERFPADQNILLGKIILHPRAAYLNGFVKKLQTDPKAGVLDIVDWVPHGMWTGSAPAEVVDDLKKKGDAGDKTENLAGMSHEQRVKFVKEFISDGKPGWLLSGNQASYDSAITIFEGIDVKERKKLYKAVEGRAWNGGINAGDEFAFTIRIQEKGKDKDIMDKTRVAKFKKIMNGK